METGTAGFPRKVSITVTQQQPEGVHPAWNGLLQALPTELHSVVIPHLQHQTKEFESEIQKTKEGYKSYEAYKELVDNKVPIERVREVFNFVSSLENDPAETVKSVIEHWNLDYVPKGQATTSEPDPFAELDDDDMTDLSKNPVIQQLLEATQSMQQKLEQQQQETENERQMRQFNEEVDSYLKDEEHPERQVIPKELLVAYMSQGASFDDAANAILGFVANKAEVPNTQQQDTQTPSFMGGAGVVGSGMPDGAVDYGHKMSKGDVSDAVTKILEAQAQQNNQG